MKSFMTFCAGIIRKMLFLFGGNAKNDCFLPRKSYRSVKACLYITKPGQHLSAQIYKYKYCLFTEAELKPAGEKMRRCCWWSFYRFYTQAVVDETFIRKCTNLSNQLLGLILTNYIQIRCDNQFPAVLIRIGFSIQRQLYSQLDKTKP